MRDLKNNLSRYLHRVGEGEELLVTDRGRPVARMVPLDAGGDRLAQLIEDGLIVPPSKHRAVPHRIRASGSVSDLVADQRR